MQTTTAQVRQVLMNEIGLTRESVRAMVEEIVTLTVDKHMSSLESSGRLNQIVETAFQRQYRDLRNPYADFKSLVSEAAANAAKAFVAEAIVIKAANNGNQFSE